MNVICQFIHVSLAADNIALAQPDYTQAVDGNLQTCHVIASMFEPYLRIDLLHVRPVALVHIFSNVSMTDVAVVVGEQYVTVSSYSIWTIRDLQIEIEVWIRQRVSMCQYIQTVVYPALLVYTKPVANSSFRAL